MSRKPRDPARPMFSIPMIIWSLFQGALAMALLAAVYFGALYWQLPEGQWRALIFFSLIAAILALILVNRSFSAALAEAFSSKNRALLLVLAAIAAVSGLIVTIDPIRNFLKFELLDPAFGGVAIATGICVLAILERLKPMAERRWFGDEYRQLS